VSADVWTRWGVFSVEIRGVNCEHRWARKDEVTYLRELNAHELRGDVADVHRKSGVLFLYGLLWEELWDLGLGCDTRGEAAVCASGSVST